MEKVADAVNYVTWLPGSKDCLPLSLRPETAKNCFTNYSKKWFLSLTEKAAQGLEHRAQGKVGTGWSGWSRKESDWTALWKSYFQIRRYLFLKKFYRECEKLVN